MQGIRAANLVLDRIGEAALFMTHFFDSVRMDNLFGEAPFVLALCAPVAFVLLRMVSPRALARQLAALLRPRLPLNRWAS